MCRSESLDVRKGKKMAKTRWMVAFLATLALAGNARAQKSGRDDAKSGNFGRISGPVSISSKAHGPRPRSVRQQKPPLPLFVTLDLVRLKRSPLAWIVKELRKKVSKDGEFKKLRRVCRMDLFSRLTKVALASRDVSSHSDEPAMILEGRFRAVRVLSCFKRILAKQNPASMRIGGKAALTYTSDSGRPRFLIVVGAHKLGYAGPTTANLVSRGRLSDIDPGMAALAPLLRSGGVMGVLVGRIPMTAAMLRGFPLWRGISAIEGMLFSLSRASSGRQGRMWRLQLRVRLGKPAEAAKLQSIVVMLQQMVGAKLGGHGPNDAMLKAFVATRFRQRGRDVVGRMTLGAGLFKGLKAKFAGP